MLRRFARADSGATAIEYGLIAALVIIALLLALTATADATAQMWADIQNAITGASSS